MPNIDERIRNLREEASDLERKVRTSGIKIEQHEDFSEYIIIKEKYSKKIEELLCAEKVDKEKIELCRQYVLLLETWIYSKIYNNRDSPFIVTADIDVIIENIRKIKNPLDRAKEIFNWMQKNIFYGESRRGRVGYRTSEEVFSSKEGVCGEMAYLYVVMCRASNILAKYVHVDIDEDGRKVNHACATVYFGWKETLVDPAYYTFDIKHKEYKIVKDEEVIKIFNIWRNR